jgi:hypothetical protein
MLIGLVFHLLATADGVAGNTNGRNCLFDELIKQGMPVPNAAVRKLPMPLFREGLDKDALDAALAKAADRLPLDLFLKRSDLAPFTLKINSINDKDEKRIGQAFDLWFVVYGKLAAVQKTDFVQSLIAGDRKGDRPEILDERQLQQRGIKLVDAKDFEERYATLDLTLLDKVKVTGVTRNVKTWTGHSILLATKLDERFENDMHIPNRWRPIMAQGDKTNPRGQAVPYAGLMGYATVVELPEPEGALLVELHFAFHEPPEWFGGLNLLRSKLPIVIQDNVRAFRRKLARQ